MDVDPSPTALTEKELKKQIQDKRSSPSYVIHDLLALAQLLILDQRSEEAKKLFDRDSIARLGTFALAGKETKRDQDLIDIVSGLGTGIVLAYQDRAEESNAQFKAVMQAHASPGKKVDPKLRPPKGGQLEQFFVREVFGPKWKRAVGEALERNAKNLDGKIPDDLRRLRMLPVKGRTPRSKSE
jgi:hypothetical protein